MMTPELLQELHNLRGTRVTITFDSGAPVPGTPGVPGMLLTVTGPIVRLGASFVSIQGEDKRELFLPLDRVLYFADVHNVVKEERRLRESKPDKAPQA